MTDYKQLIADMIGYDEITAQDVVPTQAPEFGDYCIPCFKLARTLRKSPVMIAQDLAKLPLPAAFSKAEAVNGYVNFFLDKGAYAGEVASAFSHTVPVENVGEGKTVCIDFSSVNIAKPFHMGHLPSTAIGGSLTRLFRALGYTVVGINHLGDYGTQFGKLIVSFRRNGTLDGVRAGGVKELQRLYVMYGDMEENDPTLLDEARAWSKRIEDGEPEAVEMFETFKAITLEEVNRIYTKLGVSFDSYNGESFFVKRVGPVVEELKQKNLLIESDGAQVVDLADYDMPPCLILRSDGASLYATRDLAAAFYRKKEYDFDKCLYVVAYQQNLHFKQCFKVLELMGYEWAKDMEHVAFGMVSLEGGTLSSRKGNVVYLADVLDKAVARTKEIIAAKNPNMKDADLVAERVGVGAVIYSALSGAKIKDVTFSLDKVLSFEGETGPYLEYTHARATSVLARAGAIDESVTDFGGLDNPEALALARAVADLPGAIKDAAAKREPCIVSKQLMSIASAFNKFYFDHKILGEDHAVTHSRLMLTRAARNALNYGLRLILIEPVDAM